MKGHSCDFPMYTFLISSNAFDPSLNDWLSECVHHDTDPFQLLRSNHSSRWTEKWATVLDTLWFILHMNCDFLSLHLWTSFWQSTTSQVHNHLVNNVYTYFLVYILFLLLLVYIFIFKPGMIGKNNHPCTTPGRLVLYDLYLEYFKCLNQFYAWDWKICMKVNIYQEASKNTNAHWAKKTMGVNQ